MGIWERFDIEGWLVERYMEDTNGPVHMTYQSKEPDGKMHPSTHLGCEIAACHDMDPDIPMKPPSLASTQRLLIGTLVHSWIQAMWEQSEWEGYLPECEVPLEKGLPPGWAGTADLLLGKIGDGVLHEPSFTLFDWKTIAGSGLSFLDLTRPKPEQHIQISAYYHAAEAMGYRLNPECCVVHVPVSAAQYKEMSPPIAQWMKPLPRNVVFGEMRRRSQVLKAYLVEKESPGDGNPNLLPQPMPLEQRTEFNKKLQITEHVEKPSWLIKYCRSSQCACAGQKREVISYDDRALSTGGSL